MKQARTFVIVAALLTVGCGEEPEVHYANWEQASGGGAISRGWLPEWLPRSAHNIRERHNIDTNQGAFSFSAGGRWTAPIDCVPAFDPPSPVVTPNGFPRLVETQPGVLQCGDLYVLAAQGAVYGWRN